MTLGERFKLIRNIFNLKIDDLASLLQTQKAYIYNVMRDERGISESTAQRLLETYGISPDWLKSGSGRMFSTWDKALPLLLKKQNFETIDEILLIFEAIHFTYCMAQERNVTTKYISKLFEISFYLLEKINSGDKESLTDTLPSLLGRDLGERLEKLRAVAGNDELTRGEIGRYISNLILSILEKVRGMSQEEIRELSSMVIPWSFWLARQATSQTFVRVDTLMTTEHNGYLTPGPAHVEKGIVTFDYNPSWDKDREVVLTFSDFPRVSLTTSILSLYELVYCLDNLPFADSLQPGECETKNWRVMVHDDVHIVTFNQNTTITFTKDQFSDLTSLKADIHMNKPLYDLIIHRYLDEHGTI